MRFIECQTRLVKKKSEMEKSSENSRPLTPHPYNFPPPLHEFQRVQNGNATEAESPASERKSAEEFWEKGKLTN